MAFGLAISTRVRNQAKALMLLLLVWAISLRCAALGTVSSLIDLAVLTAYISLISFGRFFYMMYTFGHDLDPRAPMNIDPFTPAILGSKQVANFTTYSYPLFGSYLIGMFTAGVWIILAAALWRGRRVALLQRSESAAAVAVPIT